MLCQIDSPFGDMRWIKLKMPGARTQLRLETLGQVREYGRLALPVSATDANAMIKCLREAGVEVVSNPKLAGWNWDARSQVVFQSI